MSSITVHLRVWAAIASLALAGCASHALPRGSVDSRSVARDSLDVWMAQVRQLSKTAAPKISEAATFEAHDPELRQALEAVRAMPTAAAHRRAAEVYRRAAILDLAYEHYAAARSIDNRDAAAYDGLARIWRDWGLPNLGLGDARRAVYYAPKSAAAHNTLGTVLYALGQTREARAEFERALALQPGAAYAWTNLCYERFQAADLRAAAERCQGAVALDPGSRAAHNDLALVYAAAGHMTLAAAEFAAAGPDAAAREYNIGIVMAAAGRYPEAARAFETAQALRGGWMLAADRARQARRLAQ